MAPSRVFVEQLQDKRLRLYITRIEEGDEGQYTCEADVNKITLSAHSHLQLYGPCHICQTLCLISTSSCTTPLDQFYTRKHSESASLQVVIITVTFIVILAIQCPIYSA